MEGPFRDPDIPDGERTAYRGLVGGEEAGSGEVVVERSADAGRDLYRQSLVARVAGRAEVRSETTFRRRSGSIHAEEHETRTLDGDEPPVAVEQARFRGVKVLHWGAEVEPYPRDLTPLLGCALALRGLEFERGARRSFSVWLVSSIYWTVETKVEKQETIELPAGELSAWRVGVRPSFEQVDKALDSVMDAVMRPVVAHFEAEPPHRLLRLEFPTGPFKWNPPGLIEATELGTGGG
jgi:Protein of unknown function (DUF3108)